MIPTAEVDRILDTESHRERQLIVAKPTAVAVHGPAVAQGTEGLQRN
jgi:hypothetical protein